MSVPEKNDQLALDVLDAARTRQCLKCTAPFFSQWNGERICKRCKASKSWQNGDIHSRVSTGKRK